MAAQSQSFLWWVQEIDIFIYGCNASTIDGTNKIWSSITKSYNYLLPIYLYLYNIPTTSGVEGQLVLMVSGITHEVVAQQI